MRKINQIIVHCSDTFPEMDVGREEIRKWHVEERGWEDIGYHFIIRRNGTMEAGRPIEEIGAHVRGENADSIGICMVGGKPFTNFSLKQYQALKDLVQFLLVAHKLTLDKVYGHYEYDDSKSCPTFDVRELLKGLV